MRSRGRGGRRAGAAVSITLALAALLVVGPVAVSGATATNAWRAKIGSGGANGTATIQAYTTGTGSIVLRLAKLKPTTYLPVTLSKGTCSSVGTTLIKFPTIKTTSTGAAARTSSLSSSQVTLIKNATKLTGRIAIRVGSSTTGGVKCGAFTVLAVPPYVAATIPVGYLPFDVALTSDAAWVANAATDSLEKVDLNSNTILSRVTLGPPGSGVPLAITTGDGALWVAVAKSDSTGQTVVPGSVVRVDPASGQVMATIPVGSGVVDIAASPGAVWVPNPEEGTVLRIDTTSNTIAATITLAAGVSGIAYGEGAVWVANETTGIVSRIDPATNQVVATITTLGLADGIAVGGGAVWVVNPGTSGVADGILSRIDPTTNQVVHTITVGAKPLFVAFGGGLAWVAMSGEPTVVAVNAATNAVTARISVGGPSWGIAATDHVVWVVQPNTTGAQQTPPQPGTLTRINY